MANDPLTTLYRRPGFMIRRAHQIAVALFLEETGELKITTTQYGILFVLEHRPGIDQVSLAKLLGLDRSTTGMVVNKLERAGLIGRATVSRDRRRRSLHLTRAGEKMLARLAAPAERAQRRVLSALAPRERMAFLDMLDRLTRSHNGTTRVPLGAHRSADRSGRKRRSARPAASTRSSQSSRPSQRWSSE